MTAPESRALSILIFIVSLLGEYCDFDRLRDENDCMFMFMSPDFTRTLTAYTAIAADLNTITQVSPPLATEMTENLNCTRDPLSNTYTTVS